MVYLRYTVLCWYATIEKWKNVLNMGYINHKSFGNLVHFFWTIRRLLKPVANMAVCFDNELCMSWGGHVEGQGIAQCVVCGDGHAKLYMKCRKDDMFEVTK